MVKYVWNIKESQSNSCEEREGMCGSNIIWSAGGMLFIIGRYTSDSMKRSQKETITKPTPSPYYQARLLRGAGPAGTAAFHSGFPAESSTV